MAMTRAAASHTEIIATPRRAQLHGLLDAIALLDRLTDEMCEADAPQADIDTACHAMSHLERLVDDARDALRISDERRAWVLREHGYDFRALLATRDEAIAEAESCTDGDYGEVTRTIWIDIHAICEETDERESVTVTIEPDEPRCVTEDETGDPLLRTRHTSHDWRDDGLQGHGGGVIIRERCRRCGCLRVTDTWATRPDTGEQGLTSISYRQSDDE